jgi:hypothetical protein
MVVGLRLKLLLVLLSFVGEVRSIVIAWFKRFDLELLNRPMCWLISPHKNL